LPFAAIDLLFGVNRRTVMHQTKKSRSTGRAGMSGLAPSRISRLTSQSDTVGVAMRLAADRLKQAGIPLGPLLRGTGLPVSQINIPDRRVSVAGQISFLEHAARALKDPLLGFHLARDFDLRLLGVLYYTAASSETLADALHRAQRYCSIADAGMLLKCSGVSDLTIALGHAGFPRHSDRQHMEFMVVTIVRICRFLTNRELAPTNVSLIVPHRGDLSEFEAYLKCAVTCGADSDKIVFKTSARQLHIASADQHLNKILVQYCEEALSHRRSNASPLRIGVENAVASLLPHGKAHHSHIARELGLSWRTLARRLAAEGVNFGEIVDQLRADLASRYLSESDLSISQITWLTGYRGVSAFTRAHKRWTGMTPTEGRNRLQS
jgi:AraC-like DNA-binding protein